MLSNVPYVCVHFVGYDTFRSFVANTSDKSVAQMTSSSLTNGLLASFLKNVLQPKGESAKYCHG